MANRIVQFIKDESGAVSAEYAIMASLIAGVIVAVVTQIGLLVAGLFERARDAIPGGIG